MQSKVMARIAVVAVAVVALGCASYGRYVRVDAPTACPDCQIPAVDLDSRIILIGDTGELEPGSPTLALFDSLTADVADRSVVLFLGDNIYPRGLPTPDELDVDLERETAKAILDQQIDALQAARVKGVFVAGNHDWDRSGLRGLDRLVEQERYFDDQGAGFAVLLPEAGCPGPTVLDMGQHVRILAIDSEWLLREDLPKRTDCNWGPPGAGQPLAGGDNDDFYAALADAVETAGGRRVLLAAHHPLKTLGSHGGRYSAKDYVFPLTHLAEWLYVPIPFLYPALRTWVRRSDQDLAGGRNKELVRRLTDVLTSAQRPAIAAGGHEHSLQVFDDPTHPIWYLVSGSGAKTEPTGSGSDTVFKHAARGLMVLDTRRDGRSALRVIVPEARGAERTFAMWLDP